MPSASAKDKGAPPSASGTWSPCRLRAVTVRSCAWARPGCLVEGESISPGPKCGPLATTRRNRSAMPASARLATTTSAPPGAAATTSPIRVSMAVICSARLAVGRVSPGATPSRRLPTSTIERGQALTCSSTVLGSKAVQWSTVPSERAAASAAPGPTARMHWPPLAAESPSVPKVASNFVALASARYAAHPGTVIGAGRSRVVGAAEGVGGVGRSAQGVWTALPPRLTPARAPADSPNQPSIGQVLVWIDRIDSDPPLPLRRSAQRFGVAFSETSPQERPPVPTMTVAPVGRVPSEAAPGIPACAPAANPPTASEIASPMRASRRRGTPQGYGTTRHTPTMTE